MDESYLCSKLKKLSVLLYGELCEPFAKVKKGMYIFGSKKYEIKNSVNKKVAIYLAINEIKP